MVMPIKLSDAAAAPEIWESGIRDESLLRVIVAYPTPATPLWEVVD